MNILLTNDDGYQSIGLMSLRRGLMQAGIHVTVVAPEVPRSGASRSATLNRPVTVERVDGDDTNPVYVCDGTPVDCVRVALLSELAPDVAAVVSGINQGANLGEETTYSGTVGAGIEGALLGLPALCLSQQSCDGRFRLVDLVGYDWTWSVAAGLILVRRMMHEPIASPAVINVNIPGIGVTGPAAVTTLGRRAYRRGSIRPVATERGKGYYTFGFDLDDDPPIAPGDSTDYAAIAAGRISLTPIPLPWDDKTVATQVDEWVRRAAVCLDTELPRELALATRLGPGDQVRARSTLRR
ncbi:5'/3'-nucleotidase SurE [Carbonactinospora thermoautotrophica]|uniref:5'/3'-nucleotidase SurE n=1 Tax=Carbonactinospora thermoautotrophica TaxID=1469144 RepID=UPI00226DDD2A|nr:5'/3'-nucleotidase SurE [Carbonactinospora thermoautotrophica]